MMTLLSIVCCLLGSFASVFLVVGAGFNTGRSSSSSSSLITCTLLLARALPSILRSFSRSASSSSIASLALPKPWIPSPGFLFQHNEHTCRPHAMQRYIVSLLRLSHESHLAVWTLISTKSVWSRTGGFAVALETGVGWSSLAIFRVQYHFFQAKPRVISHFEGFTRKCTYLSVWFLPC